MKDAMFDCISDGLTQAPLFYNAIKYSIDRLANKYFNEGNESLSTQIQRYGNSFSDMYRENFKNISEDLLREHHRKSKDPASLPNAEDIKQIIDHCEKEINITYSRSSFADNFISLRRCLCAVLTLENSRRGEYYLLYI